MEIKILRSQILKGLSLVQGIVERKTTMPILTNVLLETGNKNLSITATDLEVGINCIEQADIITQGKLAVHARSIYDIIKELPEGTVHIVAKEAGWLEIISGKSKYKIVCSSPDEFPLLPKKGQGDSWHIETSILSQMIDKTSFAMSNDETRFNLNGVFFDPVKKGNTNTLKLVATDGHRLAIIERELGVKCALDKGIIIPRKGVTELQKLLEGNEESVEMWFDSKHLIAYKGNITLVIRLIDGQFPPYEQVLPKQSKRVVAVDKDVLVHALKRVSVLSTDRTRGVKFSISPKNLDIYAFNPDVGEAREELEIAYKGETFDMGFNARYFLEAISVIEDEQIVLQMGDDTAPCVIRSEIDKGITLIVMPMRL